MNIFFDFLYFYHFLNFLDTFKSFIIDINFYSYLIPNLNHFFFIIKCMFFSLLFLLLFLSLSINIWKQRYLMVFKHYLNLKNIVMYYPWISSFESEFVKLLSSLLLFLFMLLLFKIFFILLDLLFIWIYYVFRIDFIDEDLNLNNFKC